MTDYAPTTAGVDTPPAKPLRMGELFAGYTGLGMGVQDVLDAETVWFSEYDEGPSRILAHHHTHVPNHGDITKIQWLPTCGAYEFEGCGQSAEVLPDRSGWQCHRCQKLWPTSLGKVYWPEVPEPVEIITGGYPCQPFSTAGKRKGTTDERHLWPYVRDAIRALRPQLALLENVAGHRSLGFDRVLGDLAEIGYDAQWVSLRAADVDAVHGRERVFIAAYPQGASPGASLCPRGLSLQPRGSDRLAGGRLLATQSVWQQYARRIARWGVVVGRPAPQANVADRLSPAFLEWMMGLPSGHVTDPVIWAGMTPAGAEEAQLKALGNGVVPQQAAAALRIMLARANEVAA